MGLNPYGVNYIFAKTGPRSTWFPEPTGKSDTKANASGAAGGGIPEAVNWTHISECPTRRSRTLLCPPVPCLKTGLTVIRPTSPLKSLIERGLPREPFQLHDSDAGARLHGQVAGLGMAGEQQHLVSVRQFADGFGDCLGSFGVEIHEYVVHDQR